MGFLAETLRSVFEVRGSVTEGSRDRSGVYMPFWLSIGTGIGITTCSLICHVDKGMYSSRVYTPMGVWC